MGRTRSTEVVDRIEAAAVARLEEGGVRAVTLRAVCSDAGVSKQTVLNRFDAMDGLLDYVAVRGFGELYWVLRGAETMDGLIEDYRRWAVANPARYRLMMNGPTIGLAPSAAVRRAAEQVLHGLTGRDEFVRMVGRLQLELSGLAIDTQNRRSGLGPVPTGGVSVGGEGGPGRHGGPSSRW